MRLTPIVIMPLYLFVPTPITMVFASRVVATPIAERTPTVTPFVALAFVPTPITTPLTVGPKFVPLPTEFALNVLLTLIVKTVAVLIALPQRLPLELESVWSATLQLVDSEVSHPTTLNAARIPIVTPRVYWILA